MPRALLTVYRKGSDFLNFAEALIALGWELLASGGTRDFLAANSVACENVTSLVGPPILDHRVVTLDRNIHAALLADLTEQDQVAELRRMWIKPINMVCVDLYPLADELASEKRTARSVINQTDVGGRALLMAAAKGRRYVVSNPGQYQTVLNFLQSPPPDTKEGVVARHRFLARLAAAAERTVAQYSGVSADFHELVAEGRFTDRS